VIKISNCIDFNSEDDQVNGTCSPENHAISETMIADSAASSEFNTGNKIGQELEPQFLQKK